MNGRLQLLLRDVFDGILGRPRRAALAVTAISIGMAALTVLFAVLFALQTRADRIAGEFGANVVAVLPAQQSGGNQLDDRHVHLLQAAFPECRISSIRTWQVPTLGTDDPLEVMATDPELLNIRKWGMERGRFLDDTDLRERQRHAVITSALSRSTGLNVGDLILLRDVVFRIVGILSGAGGVEGELAEFGLSIGQHTVMVPRSLPAYWSIARGPARPGPNAVLVEAPTVRLKEAVLKAAPRLFHQPDIRRRTPALTWVTQARLLESVRNLQRTLRLTAGSIAFLCLALGGTTLMSLLLANVQERVQEIGLRRALGATASQVASLFVVEGCVLTVGGSVLGIVTAWGLLHLAAPVLPFAAGLGPGVLGIPLVTALALGLLFSYAPARQAASLSPSQALRNP